MRSILLSALVIPLVLAACGGSSREVVGHSNPEAAVVAWFEAIDAGAGTAATEAVNADTFALILAAENGHDASTLAAHLRDGVPDDTADAYWASFAAGFAEFASKPIATLRVGEAEEFTSEGVTYASVPVGGSDGAGTVVVACQREDTTWEIDLVASMGDGFVRLLASVYESLPPGEDADRVRLAYAETVVPSLWAAIAVDVYGEEFARVALGIIDEVDAS